MRVWFAIACLVLAAVVGGFAFVLQSVSLACVVSALALLGLVLGRRGSGWSEDASTSSHPLTGQGTGTRR